MNVCEFVCFVCATRVDHILFNDERGSLFVQLEEIVCAPRVDHMFVQLEQIIHCLMIKEDLRHDAHV